MCFMCDDCMLYVYSCIMSVFVSCVIDVCFLLVLLGVLRDGGNWDCLSVLQIIKTERDLER